VTERAWTWLLVGSLALCLALVAYAIKQERDLAEQTHTAVCSLKNGYQEQLKYYRDPRHTAALHSLGLDDQAITAARINLKARIDDLKKADCG
jgi:hypothetical protein